MVQEWYSLLQWHSRGEGPGDRVADIGCCDRRQGGPGCCGLLEAFTTHLVKGWFAGRFNRNLVHLCITRLLASFTAM